MSIGNDIANVVDARTSECGHEIFDGNDDDPRYAYCGHPVGHAGPHGNWEE